eukprot:Gb_31695 [translate_table: standard]
MGCKGRRRREKNYRAAHGGHAPLAPPPTSKDIDAIPSKLRRIIQLRNSSDSKLLPSGGGARHGPHKSSQFGNEKSKEKQGGKHISATVPDLKKNHAGETKVICEEFQNKHNAIEQPVGQSSSSKRKWKQGDELRLLLESQNIAPAGKRKRERKKKYLEAKKKKHKRTKNDDAVEFPQHEKIQFGEVVKAPPKLEFPKKVTMEMKTRQDVSQERLRLQAIEDYRHRKGWTSRPGSHVPPINTTGGMTEA